MFLQLLVSISIVSVINGEGCEEMEVYHAVTKFSECVKQLQNVQVEKPIEGDMSEPCKKDWKRSESCWNSQVVDSLKKCITPTQEQMLHQNVRDVNGARLQFMCESNGKFMKELWKKNGAECYATTKSLMIGNGCDGFMPDLIQSDYKNPETCHQMLQYLNCAEGSFDMTCDPFAKKVVYTHFKRGLLMTPCKDYIKQNDKSNLDIIYVPTGGMDGSLAAKDGDSAASLSASFGFVILCILNILLFC